MNDHYYVGIDIGTNSVGYAVTDPAFRLRKYKSEPMWGSHVFEEGQQCAERRAFRTARRRLNRRQQRVHLTQQIFAEAISEKDARFFIRLQESALFREDTQEKDTYLFFQDETYTDREYHEQYPTIHHLIKELMEQDTPHDVRLVYLAVAWLMAHRGHFLSEVNKDNIEALLDFEKIYQDFMELFEEKPWECEDTNQFQEILLTRQSVRNKEKMFWNLLFQGKKPKAKEDDVLGSEAVFKLLSGGTTDLAKLFLQQEFAEKTSVSFRSSEEEFEMILGELGENGEYLKRLRALYDWSLLKESLHGCANISAAKVKDYEQHQKDLKMLKFFVRKYCPDQYNSVFREMEADNYVAYVYNLPKQDRTSEYKKATKEQFCDYLKKKLKDISCEPEDQRRFEDMQLRIETYSFLPKQVNADNRVIPYQLYYHELKQILQRAEQYLPFLSQRDESGISNTEKLLSVFTFRIPYFVGPLCTDGNYAWMKRKAEGKIYPWNFEEKVDLDQSENAFIDRMTNNCTYLPGKTVVPKDSLLYSKFMVLNEINNIKINGIAVPVEGKQGIYRLFERYRKVKVKQIEDYLLSNNYMRRGDVLGGLDCSVKASLKSYHDFKRLLEGGILSEASAERIIACLTYSEDRSRIRRRIRQEFPQLPEEEVRYLSKLKYEEFGRLSREFLTELRAANKETGESMSIMEALWETNDNLMQLLSDKYTFFEQLEEARRSYYTEHPLTTEELMQEMHISTAVQRSIYRTLDVIRDIRSVCGCAPQKIFVEMARWNEEKGKRTTSRREQILELYRKMDREEVRELSKQLEGKSDNELRREVLFLYFMQLGRSMYSGKAIDIRKLKTDAYNVDHIYPQCRVKDDSLSNKVLVLSEENGAKGDKYPIDAQIRSQMSEMWKIYHDRGLISDEKYRRLTRSIPFSDTEKRGFINRQLVETQQSVKAVTRILQQMFPETTIVYVKAGLAADFRHEFEIVKSRSVNDLHHAKDAYLNIVVGEVYHTKFSEKFFRIDQDQYSIKTKTVFGNKVWRGKETVWNGETDIARIKRIVSKNAIHFTRYAFERKGGLFNQQPARAAKGLVARKAGLDPAKYGGYNKTTASYFLLAGYTEAGKKAKRELMIVPIELMYAEKAARDEAFAKACVQSAISQITGKPDTAIQDVVFPLGLRKIKVNTLFLLDGFPASIAGKSTGGKQLQIASMMPLYLDANKERYVKLLENFDRRKKTFPLAKIDEVYDGIGREKNMELYLWFADKLANKPYAAAFGGQQSVLVNGKSRF